MPRTEYYRNYQRKYRALYGPAINFQRKCRALGVSVSMEEARKVPPVVRKKMTPERRRAAKVRNARRWRERFPERHKASFAKYYRANRAAILAQAKCRKAGLRVPSLREIREGRA